MGAWCGGVGWVGFQAAYVVSKLGGYCATWAKQIFRLPHHKN